jgi:DNA-binding response OmpR family regulator
MRILVIEDNAKMADAICRGLSQHGYVVDTCHLGFDGEEAAVTKSYDAIVLDLMLPDRDGIDVCRNLRRRGSSTPILMLTALSDTEMKVSGLDAGADDYLTKPFDFEELVARVRALLRRGTASEGSLLSYRDLEFDLVRRAVTRGGKAIKLSGKETALLEYLMRHPDRVVTRQSIVEKIWGLDDQPGSNVIDVHIGSLRRKIDKGFDDTLIHTVIGSGYRFGDTVDEPSA